METKSTTVRSAQESLRSGKAVLIFDDDRRESETDMVFASEMITPESIRFLRREAGGLICTTMKHDTAQALNMPYLEEIYSRFLPYGGIATDSSDMKYDSHSSFTFTINSRRTYTGITDIDRSMTINDFVNFVSRMPDDRIIEKFYDIFRIPGHVHLLIAREGYFAKRKGHTELATYLVESAGLFPSATIAEMLSDSGKAMTRKEAMGYAEAHDLIFIDGKEIIDQWTDEKSNGNRGF